MFSPEAPPPSKYHHKEPPKKQTKEATFRWSVVFKWLFIVCGIIAIAMIFINAPRQKRLVCQTPAFGAASLTTFGTCTKE